MRWIALLLLVLAIPLAAGCGSGDDGDDGDTSAADTTAGGATIQVEATEFQFNPSDLSAEAGEVTIDLSNAGSAEHAIEVEGNGVEESSDTIGGGDSTQLTVTLEEGTYTIYCPVGNHREQGMEGTLTVGSGAGSGGGTTTHDDGTSTHDDSMDTGETETDDGGGSGTDDDGSGGY